MYSLNNQRPSESLNHHKAKAEPVKKKEWKDDSQAIDLNNNDVSQSTGAVACAIAKEIPWVKLEGVCSQQLIKTSLQKGSYGIV